MKFKRMCVNNFDSGTSSARLMEATNKKSLTQQINPKLECRCQNSNTHKKRQKKLPAEIPGELFEIYCRNSL